MDVCTPLVIAKATSKDPTAPSNLPRNHHATNYGWHISRLILTSSSSFHTFLYFCNTAKRMVHWYISTAHTFPNLCTESFPSYRSTTSAAAFNDTLAQCQEYETYCQEYKYAPHNTFSNSHTISGRYYIPNIKCHSQYESPQLWMSIINDQISKIWCPCFLANFIQVKKL